MFRGIIQSPLVGIGFSRLQNSSKRETGRFLKKAPQKLLKWFYLDIVTAIPCATIYRNCKTSEIVERVRRDLYPAHHRAFSSAGFRFLEFCNRLLVLVWYYYDTIPGRCQGDICECVQGCRTESRDAAYRLRHAVGLYPVCRRNTAEK